jgi:type II secretory pathway pseudopilin PulG
MAEKHEIRASWAAVISGIAAVIAAGAGVYTSQTAQSALHASERISVESERTQLFAQFQDQYREVSSQFPAQHHQPNFTPAPGSDDFARLERYWFFVFSEWYETNKVNPAAFRDLWTNYYTPLVADGLELPSLRYVLEKRIELRGAGQGEWLAYLRELERIAADSGKPLAPNVEEILNKADAPAVATTSGAAR